MNKDWNLKDSLFYSEKDFGYDIDKAIDYLRNTSDWIITHKGVTERLRKKLIEDITEASDTHRDIRIIGTDTVIEIINKRFGLNDE